MAWYEYIIILVAIFIVMFPIFQRIIDKKNGKTRCGGCDCCSINKVCNKHFKEGINQIKQDMQ